MIDIDLQVQRELCLKLCGQIHILWRSILTNLFMGFFFSIFILNLKNPWITNNYAKPKNAPSENILPHSVIYAYWTYWLQILSELCFQRVALSGIYKIVAISTDKNTFFNDLDYKADIGQHFHKIEKSTRRRHRHKIIKTNIKIYISPLLMRPQRSQGCQKMHQDSLNMPVELRCAKIAPT